MSGLVTNKSRRRYHRFARNQLGNAGITRSDRLGGLLQRGTTSAVDLLEELRKLAGNVGSVTIQDGCIAGSNFTRVVEDDDLGVERRSLLGWVVFGVRSDIATTNILDRDVPVRTG